MKTRTEAMRDLTENIFYLIVKSMNHAYFIVKINIIYYRVHFIKRRGSNRSRFQLGDAVISLQLQIRDANLYLFRPF